MKKLFLISSALLAVVVSFAQTKSIEGTWLGTLDAGIKLRIVFHVSKGDAGNYVTTMDSPDQNVNGIQTNGTTFINDSVHIGVAAINGSYNGVLINDSTINGTWSQGQARLELNVSKVTEVKEPARPQALKPPFNYNAEEVAFDNAAGTVHLEGTFTYPTTGGPFATAILITGSGTQDRDETILGHKPFAVIADHLTKNGYAILRLDDRGAGKSTSQNNDNATSKDFADDINEAIKYLLKRPEVNKKKIGLIGHSEGGLIASMVAAKNKQVNFMILLAGPGTKGSTILSDQNEAILISSGVRAEAAKSYRPLHRQFLNAALTSADTTTAINKAWAAYVQWKKTTPEATRQQLGIASDTESRQMIRGMELIFSSPWMKYFLQSDPLPLLQQTTAKVLALNGSKDLQVLPKQNLAGIKAALQKSKSPLYEVKELPGLNHLFQTCNACTLSEYGMLEETFSPVALNEMTRWLNKNVK